MITKNCPGTFSAEVQQALTLNRDRAQWRAHPCELCGQEVDGEQKFGKWSPKPHWPSAAYAARKAKRTAKQKQPAALSSAVKMADPSFEPAPLETQNSRGPLQKR